MRSILLLVIAVSLFCFSCTSPTSDPLAGSASETVYGKIIDSKYEAAESTAVFLCIGTVEIDTVCVESTLTDIHGRYSFDNIDSGTYSLKALSKSSGSMVYRQEISYLNAAQGKNLGVDTLKLPGQLKARFVNGPTHAGAHTSNQFVKDVFCYLRNTPYFEYSDSNGVFQHSLIFPGTYTLRCLPPKPFKAIDTVITTYSDSIVDLGDIRLRADPAFSPPTVKNVALSYDTLRGIVNLTWPPVDVSDLDGYVVYRGLLNDAPVAVSNIIRDTVFSDSIGKTHDSLMDSTLRYLIKAIDTSSNQSEHFSDASITKIASPTLVTTTMRFDYMDTVIQGEAKSVILAFTNPTRVNQKITWQTDNGTALLKEKEIHSKQGLDTLVVKWDQVGVKQIKVVITDITGIPWADSFAITISPRPDVPDSWVVIDTSAPCQGQTTVAGVIDSMVYLISQKFQTRTFGIYTFNVISSQWNHVSDIPLSRQAVATTMHTGAIYVVGGIPSSKPSSDKVDKYDLLADTWDTLPPITIENSYSKLISINNSLYLMGGLLSGLKPANDLTLFKDDSAWIRMTNMTERRSNFAAADYQSNIYVFGGSNGITINQCEKYNPDQNVWTPVAPLATAGKGLAATVLDTLIFITGGSNSSDSTLSSNIAFNPDTEKWIAKKPMNIPRTEHGAAAVYGQMYVFCGKNRDGELRSVERYTP